MKKQKRGYKFFNFKENKIKIVNPSDSKSLALERRESSIMRYYRDPEIDSLDSDDTSGAQHRRQASNTTNDSTPSELKKPERVFSPTFSYNDGNPTNHMEATHTDSGKYSASPRSKTINSDLSESDAQITLPDFPRSLSKAKIPKDHSKQSLGSLDSQFDQFNYTNVSVLCDVNLQEKVKQLRENATSNG